MARRKTVDDQRAFWNRVAWKKTFQHPLCLSLVRRFVPPRARILDIGCGYGRLVHTLAAAGYRVTGIDPAEEMIARGRSLHPGLDLRTAGVEQIPTASYDAALLFSVLTTVPSNGGQHRLLSQIRRVLRPGGILYVSDLLLQDDRRNLLRYRSFAKRFGTYGVFQLPEGGVMRHHDPAWIHSLFSDCKILHFQNRNVTTMNGNPARGFQMLLRSPAPAIGCGPRAAVRK